MRKRDVTYSVLLIGLAVSLLIVCAGPPPDVEEQAEPATSVWDDPRGFDPLELPQDREIVAARYQHDSVTGADSLADESGAADTTDQPSVSADSSSNQAFRVQLLASRVYGEARRAARVAEEIFDQPIYVDYEIPNYKVRVGNFADRRAAEDYQQKAQAAGYENAWVVVVSLYVKTAAPLYDNLPVVIPDQPEIGPDSAVVQDDGE